MVTVETIGRVRHAFRVKGKGIKEIARELRLSRNTVRAIVRGDETEHRYVRRAQPLPQLGAHASKLVDLLAENATKPARESGYKCLHAADRKSGPTLDAACWAHGRRKFFEPADFQKAPVAIKTVRRIYELLTIEREITGLSPHVRHAVRKECSKPLVAALSLPPPRALQTLG